MNKLLTGVMGFLLLSAGALPARADGMRCGTRLVSSGDSTYDVEARCGAPDGAVRRTELRTVSSFVAAPCNKDATGPVCGYQQQRQVEVQVDEWTYDFGPHKLVRILVFENGVLRDVRTGHYGVKAS